MINKENILKAKAGMSFLEIMILVIGIFAFSYLIYQPVKILDNNQEWKKALKQKTELEKSKPSLTAVLIASLIEQFTKPILPRVSAQDSSLSTCKLDKQGAVCQEYPSISCDENCQEPCFPGKREDFSECKLGCCINDDGKCITSSPKAECEAGGNEWKDDKGCSPGKVPECKLGCCVLGSRVKALVTEKQCEFFSANAGVEIDYRPNLGEPECLGLALTQVKGACVIGNTCRFVTEQECVGLSGGLNNFYENLLCTNPDLNTTCTRTKETTCIEGKDEVYFVDSCGNPANIYDASKINDDDYWSRVYNSDEVCGDNDKDASAGSKVCGNCNYFFGTKCKNYQDANADKPNYGEFICADMNCKGAPASGGGKQDRRNGESWCVYDGYIGEGKDVAGSRHWKLSCIDGEVKVEPCADFRNEICVESEVDIGRGKKFSAASCRLNRWQECINYNTQDSTNQDLINKCEKNEDCFVGKVNVDEFKFNYCSPNYPPGFDLKRDAEINQNSGKSNSEAICGMASQKCIVIYEKKISGWKCIVNCDCETAKFTNQMNDFCTSLGDCGGYVNIEGKYNDDGYKVVNAPKLGNNKINKYRSYAKAIEGQKAEPGDFSEILSGLLGIPEGLGEANDEIGDSGAEKFVGGVMGGVGVAYVIGVATQLSTGFLSLGALGLEAANAGFVAALTELGLSTGVAVGFTNALGGAGLGAVAGIVVAKLFGLQGDAALIVVVTGAVVGAVAAAMTSILMGGLYGLIAAVIMAILMLLFGIGKTKKVVVKFECKPWQPPIGGDDCDKCNEGFKTCSKYRCQSLGQACEFLNEGTGNEICVASKNDNKAPEIKPWEQALTAGYKYELTSNGFKIRQEDDECIPEFTPISFGISTNKPSQCKYEVMSTSNYDAMENYFGGSNLFIYNHTMALSLPSVESIAEQFNITTQNIIEKYGNLKFYIRCQDTHGNFNLNEYLIDMCIKQGPDTTPPRINKFEPASNSYLKFNETEKNITIYVNEPAECRYSLQDKDFELMENSMNCEIDLQEQTIYGWKCYDKLRGLSSGENKFYFRCKDKPWLESDFDPVKNQTRFANQQSTEYILKISENKLRIDSLKPNSTIVAGGEPISVTLEAKTSGGAENGKASCYYKFSETGTPILFFNTFSDIHTQVFSSMFSGLHIIYVECEDVAGNKAEAITNFKLELDTKPPKVIRIYRRAGNVYLYTDENSECSYSFKNCRFLFENGTLMSGGFSQQHTVDWTANTYYIKCRDAWGNGPAGCSIKIHPGAI